MAEEEKGEDGQKPKSKKMLFIIVGVVLLLVGGGVPAFLFLGGSDKAKEESHEEEAVHLETVELDTFIVNLSENSSFLKVKLLLEYNPKLLHAGGHGHGGGGAYGGGGSGGGAAAPAGLPGVLGEREPMIRDAVISILSSKRAEEVLTPVGKQKIKQELIDGINAATGLEEGPITNIYFLEFIVQ